MTGDKDNEAPDLPKLDKLDTLRPPAGSDAYSAETVVRQAPPELIEAARAARSASLDRSAARREEARPPAPAPDDDPGDEVAAEGANKQLPTLHEEAQGAEDDDVETQLWKPSTPSEGPSARSARRQARVSNSVAPLDKTNPLFVMFVLLAALLAGAGLAYWLSAPKLH
jgi:hypothetical protein